MVWEQRSSLIVMVTELEEKGRKKCHKYWPDEDEGELDVYGNFSVKFVSEEAEASIITRHFELIGQKVGFLVN